MASLADLFASAARAPALQCGRRTGTGTTRRAACAWRSSVAASTWRATSRARGRSTSRCCSRSLDSCATAEGARRGFLARGCRWTRSSLRSFHRRCHRRAA
eukprot:6188979-Pleurochrysis_carterae.AAC.1